MPEPHLPPLAEPELSSTEPCRRCDGTGVYGDGYEQRCPWCEGDGIERDHDTAEGEW